MDKDALTRVLRDYCGIKKPKRTLSVFDVAGYPHYENVCSNILEFYLRPNEVHGFGFLVLNAFLEIAEIDTYPRTSKDDVKVVREHKTIQGGRIDLLIETSSFVIGIENKIYSGLTNDIDDYKRTVSSIAASRPNRFILLSPVLIPNENDGIINITYRRLWEKVRQNFGFHTSSLSQKWNTYLIDFMETTESLKEEFMEFTDDDKFFVDNKDSILELIGGYNAFTGKLHDRVKLLKGKLDGKEFSGLQRRWIYSSTCLVHDYKLSENRVAFDLYVSTEGWVLQFFGRNSSARQYVIKLVSVLDADIHMDGDRFVLQTWDKSTSLDVIADNLCEWMERFVQVDIQISKT